MRNLFVDDFMILQSIGTIQQGLQMDLLAIFAAPDSFYNLIAKFASILPKFLHDGIQVVNHDFKLIPSTPHSMAASTPLTIYLTLTRLVFCLTLDFLLEDLFICV